MKKTIKKALSLLGIQTTIAIASLPAIVCSSKVYSNVSETLSTDASKFLEGTSVSGTVYYQIEGNNIKICADNDPTLPPDVEGTNVTFKDSISLNSNASYTLIEIMRNAFSTIPDNEQMVRGSVKFKKSLKSIGQAAFSNQNKVTSYDFSNIVSSTGINIGEGAFNANTGLTTVKFGDNMLNLAINKNAFSGCSSLNNIIFPKGLTVLGDSSFKGCLSLSKITFSCQDVDAIKAMSVGTDVFKNCNNLKTVSVPTGMIDTYYNKLKDILPDKSIYDDGYTPTPDPKEDTKTPGWYALVIGLPILGAIIIALAIALPILKKQGKLKRKNKRKQYKEPLASEDKAIKEKKYQVNKIVEGRKCPLCKHPLVVKKNKKGQKFIACTNYPRCTYTESIDDEVRDFAAEKMK